MVRCNDAACTGGNESISTVDDPANNVGSFSSIAIGSDGLPVISYRDNSAQAVKIAKCNDESCTGENEIITTLDDTANDLGWYTSIAIGSDGLPVISYSDFSVGVLKVAKCYKPACN